MLMTSIIWDKFLTIGLNKVEKEKRKLTTLVFLLLYFRHLI